MNYYILSEPLIYKGFVTHRYKIPGIQDLCETIFDKSLEEQEILLKRHFKSVFKFDFRGAISNSKADRTHNMAYYTIYVENAFGINTS